MRPHYYHRDGTPFATDDVTDWAREFGTMDRRVGLTDVTDAAKPGRKIRVSTVFLGIDHAFGDGPPLLFESMAFHGDDGEEEMQDRYSTEAQAAEGHAAMVAQVAATMAEPVVTDVEDSEWSTVTSEDSG